MENRRITVPALAELGWSSFFEDQIDSDDKERTLVPARVAGQARNLYRLWSETAEWSAEVSGRLRFDGTLPAVGDWVLVNSPRGDGRAIVHRVLRRQSRISRKAAGGRVEEQVLAANVDTIFLVTSLNRDFNARRIERALTVAWESGARPVVLLSKADLTADAAPWREQAAAMAVGVPVLVTSAITGDGLDEIRQHLSPGSTAVLVGSSGVGKSTLVNALLGGATLRTAAVREHDDRGRHTTTSRQMLRVAGAGLLIDTPGLRELQLWDSAAGLGQAFADVEAAGARCHFADCRHESEPGCAVRQAVEAGLLDPERVQSYHKLRREQEFLDRKRDPLLRSEEQRKWKATHKALRRLYRDRKS
jgi:ribosome biogenesis GTPase / thiamine phosphate phosphatase